ANAIATWNPATGQWSALGSGLTGPTNYPEVYALAAMPNGDLIAGGNFYNAGGSLVRGLARWNGSGWTGIGSGVTSGNSPGEVDALVVLPNGGLVVGGRFDRAGSVAAINIARWDGAQWHAMASAMQPAVDSPGVWALVVLPGGDLVAGGAFATIDGV